MKGRNRKFLWINLSNNKTVSEIIPEAVELDFIGGRGFGIHYLYKELAPRIDPLGEANKIILVAGPLAGTGAQGVSRWMVYTKSPLTGTLVRSCAGADFGAWIRFASYDFILIEGKAEKPAYIHITPDACQILPAVEIWGKNTQETQDWLLQKHGKNTRAACIGPAAERGVKYAVIMSSRRTASRGGPGTVMASKNLKAVAITASRNIQLHDPVAFDSLVKQQIASMKDDKQFHHHAEWGTTTTPDMTNPLGIFPVRNFRYGQQENYEKMSSVEYRKFRIGDFGCYSCAAQCGKKHRVSSGPYAGAASSCPEHETIWAFRGPTDNHSIEATIAADQMCDDFGLDTITTGNAIGFAYELYEKGIITSKDTDGLELTYGNHAAMVALIPKIARREGFGNVLAEGVKRAAEIIGKGAEAYAIHVKGLEPPAYEPRGAKCMGFNYATSPIGASHNYGWSIQEIIGVPFPRPVDRFAEAENADIVIFNQNNGAVGEVGIVCSFARGWLFAVYNRMLAAATGIDQVVEKGYIETVAERIVNLERAFIVREGFRRRDDVLPKRMQTEPLHTLKAPGEGQMIRDMEGFLDKYYELRGWTAEGIPSAGKLNSLGLGHIAKDMTAA